MGMIIIVCHAVELNDRCKIERYDAEAMCHMANACIIKLALSYTFNFAKHDIRFSTFYAICIMPHTSRMVSDTRVI